MITPKFKDIVKAFKQQDNSLIVATEEIKDFSLIHRLIYKLDFKSNSRSKQKYFLNTDMYIGTASYICKYIETTKKYHCCPVNFHSRAI